MTVIETSSPAEYRRALIAKLGALKGLLRALGFYDDYAAADTMRLSAFDALGPDVIVEAVAQIRSETATDIQRAACGVILDVFYPGWRRHSDPALVGPTVHRRDTAVRHWRQAALDRDGHRCQDCGESAGLEVHHVVRWADSPWLRLAADNAVTLCAACHKGRHNAQT